MTKYILKKKIPGTDYGVGYVFETNTGFIKYLDSVNDIYLDIYPHEILMMCMLGILEEVKEEKYKKWNEEHLETAITQIKEDIEIKK